MNKLWNKIWAFLDPLPPKTIWNNEKLFPQYYFTPDFRNHCLTPEEWRMVKNAPENEVCDECNKPMWTCFCNVDAGDISPA